MSNTLLQDKKAFTLIELMIVLAIIASLSGLGVAAIIQFRNGVELSNGIAEVNSYFQQLENNARNASSTGVAGNAPDYYVLEIQSTLFQTKYCTKQGPTGSTCTNGPTLNEPTNINWYTSNNPCIGIGYEKRSGNLILRLANGTVVDNGQCTFSVTLQSNTNLSNPNLIKTYIFDASNDTFKLQ